MEEIEVDELIFSIFNKKYIYKNKINLNDINTIYDIEIEDNMKYILKIYNCDIPIVENCIGSMKYVHENTKIKIPKIISHGKNYILMEKVNGIILENIWDNFTYENKIRMINQYFDIIKELNNLKHKKICGIDRNKNIIPSIFHYRWNPRFYVEFNHGPFDGIKNFIISEIIKYIKFIEKIEALADVKKFIPKLYILINKIKNNDIMFPNVDICMTHNDLGPHNILVDNNGDIVSVIDWDFSGFNPSYFEWKISIQDAFFKFPIDKDPKIQDYVINLLEERIPDIKYNIDIDELFDCFRDFVCIKPCDDILKNGIKKLDIILNKYIK